MSVVAFVNGEIGLRALPIIARRSELRAVVVHPVERAHGREMFEQIAADAGAAVYEATILAEPKTRSRLRDLRPEWGISAGFGYILRPSIFEIPSRGTLNVHTSMLPWNRGAHPNVWTIVDETPAGVTLHWIDEGVDTGDVLVQREVSYDWTDTGQTLQARLLDALQALVEESWPPSEALAATRRAQPSGGSVHRVGDLASLDILDPDAEMPVRRVLNILRARTFPPFPAAGVRTGTSRVEMLLTPRRTFDGR